MLHSLLAAAHAVKLSQPCEVQCQSPKETDVVVLDDSVKRSGWKERQTLFLRGSPEDIEIKNPGLGHDRGYSAEFCGLYQ